MGARDGGREGGREGGITAGLRLLAELTYTYLSECVGGYLPCPPREGQLRCRLTCKQPQGLQGETGAVYTRWWGREN